MKPLTAFHLVLELLLTQHERLIAAVGLRSAELVTVTYWVEPLKRQRLANLAGSEGCAGDRAVVGSAAGGGIVSSRAAVLVESPLGLEVGDGGRRCWCR